MAPQRSSSMRKDTAAPQSGGLLIVAKYINPLDFSQAENDLRIMREYLTHLGRVVVLVQSPDRRRHVWEEPGIRVEYVPRLAGGLLDLVWFVPVAAWRALHLARAYDLHVGNGSDLAGAFALFPAKWRGRLRLLIQLQFQFFEMPAWAYPLWKRLLFRWGARIACAMADSVRCVAACIRDQAIRAGVDSRKLVVIPTRCDTDLFDPSRFSRRPPEADPVLLYVGSLVRRKGLDLLIAALPEVVRAFPRVRVRLVGDGAMRESLRREAARRGLTEVVEFVGPVPHRRLPEHLAEADAFVFPSRSEAMPRAVLEAMAMARPVIATPAGGIPEVIRDGVDGVLVPPEDPAGLAAGILSILGDRARARAMGARARQRIIECYGFETNVKRLVEWHRLALGPVAGPKATVDTR